MKDRRNRAFRALLRAGPAPMALSLVGVASPAGAASSASPQLSELTFSSVWEVLRTSLTAEEIAALSLTLALVAFSVLAAILYVRTKSLLADTRARARRERAALLARVDRAESLLRADRQIVVSWPGGSGAPELQREAGAVPDAPGEAGGVLDFARWLHVASAEALDAAIGRLRDQGTAFDLTLTTCNNSYVEAEGRAVGGRAVMRLREVSGLQRELADLRERHLAVSAESRALQGLLDALELPAWIRDQAGQLSWVNRAYAQACGAASADEAVSEKCEIAPAPVAMAMGEARRSRSVFTAEADVGTADTRRRLALTEVPVPTGAAGLGLDTDATTRLKAALEREAAIRAEILDRIDTAVAVFDARRRLTFCNKAYRALWQFDPAWLIGKPDFEEILEKLRADERVPTPPDGLTWRQWVDSLIDAGGREVRTSDWDLPNASLSLKLVTIPHRDGGSTHLFHNLTESLDLQTRIRAQSRVQRQTLDSLSEAIAVFGQNGKLKLSNPRFAEMWKLDAKALKQGPHIDTIIADCRKLHDADQDWLALKQHVCGFMDARAPMARTLERRDETAIALSTVPLADGATLVVFADITASKAAERALRERNEALEQAAELRSGFVSNVSYHLRDPLQSIIGFAQLLSGPSMTHDAAQQSEYAGYILSSSTSLMAIVNDILDLASIEANVLELDIGDVDVPMLINTAADALKDRITERKVDLAVDVAPAARTLQGDARRIRQIVFSLLANAVAFSNEGGKVMVDAFAEGDAIAIRVSDQGQGIPARYRNRVFDSFETRDETARHRGPGLGLSLAKGFAEKHGGSIDLESEPGKGTVVTVHLPRTQTATAEPTGEGTDAPGARADIAEQR